MNRWSLSLLVLLGGCDALEAPAPSNSGISPTFDPPAPLPADTPFDQLKAELEKRKPGVMAAQSAFLNFRYDLADRPSGVTMTRGKPVQGGVRVKLPAGRTFAQLAALTPEQIKAQDLFPAGFLPLPHPNHKEGGMLFPQPHIDDLLAQTGRDLNRFDLDFDIPTHFLPEFPSAIFLTTRPDLGDVSQGKLVTSENFFSLFKDILNPKQLDGFRLLVTPFAQGQFNLTDDRRSARPSLGVTCFDCHANGNANGAAHLVGDIRPQEFRNRIETPSLRGAYAQRIFGSQRALMSVEDFTEFEQRAAYFDGDAAAATRKGISPLDRGTQVHAMAEMERIFDFPPAPKLDVYGRLNRAVATAQEVRGETLFFGKARCSTCHAPPFYTDTSMRDLRLDRFFAPRLINAQLADADGPIKTTALRGIKETPPYFHDGRLLTLEDTIEFFNLVLELKLSAVEKRDLLAFMHVL